MGFVNVDIGNPAGKRVILVGDYLDRYPDALIDDLAQAVNGVPARIKFWLQTHQVIDLDGEGQRIADYALSRGLINQAQHDAVLA
ncbi:MAG: hypothetical protein N0E58_15835 [Candidatus Thiodiazotropha endolucinida]|uniref:Uncharacterized protein n=1 Tax=Candidatus Thiodiazotropha taylori TaxID=2792791 RepID=A0A9E4TU90_9GAMM|nr:hypothetical protein [Candidatus Thiodiazotropha taylori]MCW4237718.1 hypothetical protein [Candidatus Thiodiazotropha endolucinida]